MANESKDDAVIVIDNAGLVVNWSAAAERIHGWAASDIVGKHFSMFHVPDASEKGQHSGKLDLAAQNGWLALEAERVRKDGTRFLAEVVITVLHDRDGKLSGFAKIIREIPTRTTALSPAHAASDRSVTSPGERPAALGLTDQADIDAKVRISEIRYRRLFEAAQDGVLLLDPGTRKITDANPYILNLLDYSLDQLVGKELFEIGLLRDEAASREMFERLQRHDQVRYEDLPLESRTGRHQEVEVVANVYDENGRSVIQCNIRDITERKKVEEHNKMLMAEVNHRSKNLLAVVQAVAKQTARRGDPATFIDRLCDRMDGLAASQDLSGQKRVEGGRTHGSGQGAGRSLQGPIRDAHPHRRHSGATVPGCCAGDRNGAPRACDQRREVRLPVKSRRSCRRLVARRLRQHTREQANPSFAMA